MTQYIPNASAPSTRVDLSIAIVTYRCREDALNCLRSLYSGGLDGLTAEVILVDNASGDDTAEAVRAAFPQVQMDALPENVGFARANNIALAHATGRYVLLLNPDTLVPERTLARCLSFLASQPDSVAAMTCRVESPDGSLQTTCTRRLITPWSECCRALLLDRVFSRFDLFNREAIVGWDRRDARPVECLLGAFLLARRDAWESIGGLDDRFFLMYEDVDWCKRVWDAGQTIWFWPDAHIVHLGGQSWKHEPIATFVNSHRAALQYFEKHYPRRLGLVRGVAQLGMQLKIALLRLNGLRKPGDEYTRKHLEMAHAAAQALREPLPSVLPAGVTPPQSGNESREVSV